MIDGSYGEIFGILPPETFNDPPIRPRSSLLCCQASGSDLPFRPPLFTTGCASAIVPGRGHDAALCIQCYPPICRGGRRTREEYAALIEEAKASVARERVKRGLPALL